MSHFPTTGSPFLDSLSGGAVFGHNRILSPAESSTWFAISGVTVNVGVPTPLRFTLIRDV